MKYNYIACYWCSVSLIVFAAITLEPVVGAIALIVAWIPVIFDGDK